MRYMLDTNICIALMRGRAAHVFDRLRSLSHDQVAISAITLAELRHGVARSARPAYNAQLLVEFCAPLVIAPFEELAAESYGDTRARLEALGQPIGPLDTLIAAHALSLGLTLVTANEREFRRVEGLRVENWLNDERN